MSMISEQVANLREKAQIFEDSGCATNGIVKTFREAADTIEELSAKLATVNMEQSTAHYNNGWIPVSEGLPDESGKYLIQGINSYDGNPYFAIVHINVWNEKRKCWLFDGKPVAWMPLPEPYKGVE